MERPAHEENEAKILYFKREKMAEGVHVARVGLEKGESSMFHRHTATRDTFYVMSGRLSITLRLNTSEHVSAYRSLCSTPPHVEPDAHGGFVHKTRVLPGEVFVIEPGVVHCAANVDDTPCHFLCIEGVGEYDFVEVPP